MTKTSLHRYLPRLVSAAQDLQQLEQIEGIAVADGRLSGDLRLLLPEQEKIISLHVLGYQPEMKLNQITLLQESGTVDDEMLFIGEKMCEVYQFAPQQSITLLLAMVRRPSFLVDGPGSLSIFLRCQLMVCA